VFNARAEACKAAAGVEANSPIEAMDAIHSDKGTLQ